jgi:hypothetical protein
MPSPASRLNTAQKGLIRITLRNALVEGHKFRGIGDVKEYLKDAGVSKALISTHIEEIFDCYLNLPEQDPVGQLLGSSPPPSEGLPVQPLTKTVAAENYADTNTNGIAPPVFHSDVSFLTVLNNSANRGPYTGDSHHQLLPATPEQLASHRREDLRR